MFNQMMKFSQDRVFNKNVYVLAYGVSPDRALGTKIVMLFSVFFCASCLITYLCSHHSLFSVSLLITCPSYALPCTIVVEF